MAWYHVSANPAGKGTSQTKDELFEGVVIAYHFFYKKLGGVPPKPRKGVIPKVRTGKACRTKWQTMNTCVTKFLSCDVLSSHTLRKSGATPKDFRADALEYYIKRHGVGVVENTMHVQDEAAYSFMFVAMFYCRCTFMLGGHDEDTMMRV